MCLQLVNHPLCHWGMPNCRPNAVTIIQALPSPLIVKACKCGFKSQAFTRCQNLDSQFSWLGDWNQSVLSGSYLITLHVCHAGRTLAPGLLYCISICRVTENISLQMRLILEMDTNLFWVIPHQLKLSWNLASGKLTTIVVHAPGATKGK